MCKRAGQYSCKLVRENAQSLFIKIIKIKTTINFYPIVRMASIEKTKTKVGGDAANGPRLRKLLIMIIKKAIRGKGIGL